MINTNLSNPPGKHYQLHHGGQWREPHGKGVIDVFSPATGALLGHVPVADPDDVSAAATSAAAGAAGWRSLEPLERARHMNSLASLLRSRIGDRKSTRLNSSH